METSFEHLESLNQLSNDEILKQVFDIDDPTDVVLMRMTLRDIVNDLREEDDALSLDEAAHKLYESLVGFTQIGLMKSLFLRNEQSFVDSVIIYTLDEQLAEILMQGKMSLGNFNNTIH